MTGGGAVPVIGARTPAISFPSDPASERGGSPTAASVLGLDPGQVQGLAGRPVDDVEVRLDEVAGGEAGQRHAVDGEGDGRAAGRGDRDGGAVGIDRQRAGEV